jgi:hypothetical protein
MGVELSNFSPAKMVSEWDVTQKIGVTMGPQQQKKLKYVGI